MAKQHNPYFVIYPVNNNRTAWRPVSAPFILVVPHRRDVAENPIPNSQIFNVRIYIENVPQEAKVAGHDHIGIRFPDKELYAYDIDAIELGERILDIDNIIITRNGEEIPVEDAQTGDLLQYTSRSGVISTLEYIQGANYYDLSDVAINVELLPSDQYNLVAAAEYFTRVVSEDNALLCINASSVSLALARFRIVHPGPVMDEFYRMTPPPFLTNTSKAEDQTVAFYRPFTDILQDIADEQNLLESINWVFETPAEAIPYLSQLLGWDLPYFPQSVDQLRRAVLRRTTEFQNLKGSRRAIINIFRLFGFEILINNLWWSSDGERLIRPEENLPLKYKNQEITIEEKYQIDIGLDAWSNDTFGVFEIPLLARPQMKAEVDDFVAVKDGGNVTIEAYLVTNGSPAQLALSEIAESLNADPLDYGSKANCVVDDSGVIESITIRNKMAGLAVDGYSQILISGKLGKAVSETSVGIVPLTKYGASLNRDNNKLSVTLNGVFDENQVVYLFITYIKQNILVPDIIKELQSNRFDITVINDTTVSDESLVELANPVTLDFAIEFLYKLKAFHSLLYVIRERIDLNENYEVTDLCVGGDYIQRYDTDIGSLQVPPAIIPNIPSEDNCGLDPQSLGYKQTDRVLRQRKLISLQNETNAYQLLDDREYYEGEGRLAPLAPADREAMKYNPYGQDRVISQRVEKVTTQFSPDPNANSKNAGYPNQGDTPQDTVVNGLYDQTGPAITSNSNTSIYSSFTREYADIRQPWITLDDRTDYCFKGRVDDEILYSRTFIGNEAVVSKPCSLGIGTGVYYTYPAYSQLQYGNINKSYGSMSMHARYTGGATGPNQRHYLGGVQQSYLSVAYDTPLPIQNESLLGRLYRDYSTPSDETLHYYNERSAGYDQKLNLALIRPNIHIDKPTMHFPGCRFAVMYALQDDFTHPTYTARPWDDPYSTYCGPANSSVLPPDFLNARMITVGNEEYLTFDSVPFTIGGNNLLPDISSMGEHTLGTDYQFGVNDVVHKVYMQNATGHPAIQLEGVCDYGAGTTSNGIIEVDKPLFQSHNDCGTSIIDFADGYPCVTGYQLYSGEDNIYQEVLDGLGLPSSTASFSSPITYLFALGSGILSEFGIRLDCGCLLASCDWTESFETICSISPYYDDDGTFNPEPDKIDVDIIMRLDEAIGIKSNRVDGSIPTFFELIP